MSLNQQVIAEFSPCTPSAPQLRDLSIQTFRPTGKSPLEISERYGVYLGLYCLSVGSRVISPDLRLIIAMSVAALRLFCFGFSELRCVYRSR